MAALSTRAAPELIKLRRARVSDLDPVLCEEEMVWRRELDWDFAPSAALVRRFVGMQALQGYLAACGGRAAGYVYFVVEEQKGLIGDLYVLREFAGAGIDDLLMRAVLEELMALPAVARIESQLLMLDEPFRSGFPHEEFLRIQSRNFMVFEARAAHTLKPGRAAAEMLVENWRESRHDDAARLIAAAYDSHVDAEINDQYRSTSGARRFLMNIVQYPGCGSFFQEASFVGLSRQSGGLAGMSLASLVASDVGHITQVCVSPSVRGSGVGYELLRRSLVALADYGCRKVSLTVTEANANAVVLYERMGFVTTRRFAAHVWQGF
jgi:ribosomal protein S18 acetylase RimI-like enzyme